ncbi:GIY-YIG nuclease family protein [Haloferula sp.]|uniref:GIY-YIG nuclease family protein n=1 Tax=Haloferula sp. TaxID=2497595 RepID=UPI003C7116C1
MFCTYILESISNPERHYVGHSADLKVRLSEHNAGKSANTAKHRPWKVRCYFAFETESLARNFEKYLKSGSGRTFTKRHFVE